MNSIKVEILSTRLIKPLTPTPPHLQSYKLSFFDQLMFREHVPLVLVYPRCNNDDDDQMDERMEQSFSKILTRIYPIAGRYADDKYSPILCHDQGVPYTKAKINCKLDYFLQQVAINGHDVTPLLVPHTIKDVDESNLFEAPIFTVQITKFECGGMAVATSLSHPVLDGFTTLSFMVKWANVCRLGTPIDKINDFFNFNISDIFPTRDLSSYFKPPILPEGKKEEKFVSKSFVIKEASILKLRKKFARFVDLGVLNFQPTKVEMISAIIWRAFIRASEVINGNLRPSIIDIPLNLRSKADLPQIKNAFGNLVTDVSVKFVPGETQLELHHLVTLIRNTMTKIASSCAKASPDEIVSQVTKLSNERFQELGGNDIGVDNLMVASLCGFPVQDTDFGWGKSNLIFFGLKNYNMLWLRDTACLTGMVAQVDLEQRHMELFESDLDIKTFITCNYLYSSI